MALEARIKHKRDTLALWEVNNPILLDGEIVLVEMTDGEIRIKTGDGSTAFSALPYLNETVIDKLETRILALETALTTLNVGFASTEDDM